MLKRLNIDSDTNENALVAVLVGVLSILLPSIGFFLGFIGIFLAHYTKKLIRQTSRSKSSLSTVALLLSITGIVLHIIIGILIYWFLSKFLTEWAPFLFYVMNFYYSTTK